MDAATKNNTFRELVKKLNHMISDLTGGSRDNLFRCPKGSNVAILTVGGKSLTFTPTTIWTAYRKLQRMENEFGGQVLMTQIVFELLLNK